MAIPESQLKTWSKQGATVGSADTHKSIRNALAQHSWPSGMDYNAYWLCCMKPGQLCWPLGFLVYAFFVIG